MKNSILKLKYKLYHSNAG